MTGKDGQRRPKAADITDAQLVAAIAAEQVRQGVAATWWNVAAVLGFPEKVVLAKMRSAVRRGVIGAECTCGCKGPYWTLDYRTPEGLPVSVKVGHLRRVEVEGGGVVWTDGKPLVED